MSGIRTLLTAILVLLVSTAMGEIGLGAPVATTMTQVSPVFVKEAEVRKESRPTLTKQEHDLPAVIGGIDMGGTGTFRSDKKDKTDETQQLAYSGEHVIFDTGGWISGQAPVSTVVVTKVEIDKSPGTHLVDAKTLSAHPLRVQEQESSRQGAAHAKVTKGAAMGEQYEGMYA